MKELLVNQVNKVYYNLFVQGTLTAPTGSVKVSVVKDAVTLVDKATATLVATGQYSYVVPTTAVHPTTSAVIDLTSIEGILTIIWYFTISGTSMVISEEYVIVTPYVNWIDFRDPSITDVAVQQQKYADFLEAERVSRLVIDTYCGQTFGKIQTTYAIEGLGQEGLNLPRRIIVLDSVKWFTSTTRPGEIIGATTNTWEITATGWQIRRPYPRTLSVIEYPSRFKRNTTYNVAGLWGWESVPTAVEEAAKIITADYLCADHKYRDRYIDAVKSGDWQIKFAIEAWNGTGNATADALLTDYRIYPGIGVI